MRTALWLLALFVVALVLLFLLLPQLNPDVRAARDRDAIERGHWLTIGLKLGIVIALAWGCSRALKSWRDVFLVEPSGGLYPTMFLIHRIFGVRDAHNEEHAQLIAAAVNGSNKLPGSFARPLLAPPEPEVEMPAEILAAPELPGLVSINDAPLRGPLCLPIGVSADGPLALPLRNLGNGLVGGLPGTGKSECLAAMMAGLLRQDATGRAVQLAVVDMKGGADFGRLPDDLAALRWPVAREPADALELLSGVVSEIDRRNRLFADTGSANIEAFNAQSPAAPLPYLVAFFDEIMLLTMPAQDRSQDRSLRQQSVSFASLAVRACAIGRAAGVSLIMATQRPSGVVIPTMLRDLTRWRVAFRCGNQISSAAVLGQGGAEMLPAIPGRSLISVDETPRLAQTYLAGIETGRFDRFLQGLPRRAALPSASPTPALSSAPDPTAGPTDGPTDAPYNAAYTLNMPLAGPNAAVSRDSRAVGESREDWERRVWRAYMQGNRTITGAQRILFPDQNDGGSHWKEIAAIVELQKRRRGWKA